MSPNKKVYSEKFFLLKNSFIWNTCLIIMMKKGGYWSSVQCVGHIFLKR